MSSPDLDLQALVFAALDAATTITVTAHAVAGLALPYIVFGNSDQEDNPAGKYITFEVHSWSSAEGSHEVKTMQETIRAALEDTAPSNATWSYTVIRQDYASCFRDIDNETWHGVQRFRTLASLKP